MFTSTINTTGIKEVNAFFDALRKDLINPEWELDQASKRVMSDIQDHFNKELGPVNRWKPSKRVLKHGGKTLTKSGALRRGLKAEINKKYPKFTISIKPSQATISYASVHNNGSKMKSRSGSIYYMPKRQYAWVSSEAKKEIIQLFSFGI